MDYLGILLILFMGADDWRTRNTATEYFDTCCKYNLLSYKVEMFAFKNKDLEIQHRAETVLSNYYFCGSGRLDPDIRRFAWTVGGRQAYLGYMYYEYPTKADTDRLEKLGWLHQQGWLYPPESGEYVKPGQRQSYFMRKALP